MTYCKKAQSVARAALLLALLAGSASAEEKWRAEFDDTCGKTTQAMTLSPDELQTLLDRCAALERVIESQEESVRKVFLKRLKLCRDLYAYVLDYKRNAQSAK